MSKNSILAFVHIEKTAGTTLNQYLMRSMFGYHPCLSSQFHTNKDFDQNYLSANEFTKLHRFYPLLKGIGGHSLRSNAGYGEGSCSVNYFTFLRDPVTRFLSQFYYHTEMMNINWTFDNFLDNGGYNNLMCRRICGQANADAAINELVRRYYFVGLIENFDESMRHFRVLSNQLGYAFKDINMGAKNVRANCNKNSISVSEDMLERVKTVNAEDSKLYNFVKKYGPTLDGKTNWSDASITGKTQLRYGLTDHAIGFLNRVLSVGYCRQVERRVRILSKRS